jgi:hypothetical protein
VLSSCAGGVKMAQVNWVVRPPHQADQEAAPGAGKLIARHLAMTDFAIAEDDELLRRETFEAHRSTGV